MDRKDHELNVADIQSAITSIDRAIRRSRPTATADFMDGLEQAKLWLDLVISDSKKGVNEKPKRRR